MTLGPECPFNEGSSFDQGALCRDCQTLGPICRSRQCPTINPAEQTLHALVPTELSRMVPSTLPHGGHIPVKDPQDVRRHDGSIVDVPDQAKPGGNAVDHRSR